MLQVPQIIPAVWVYSTAPAYNGLRPEGFAAFLSDADKSRLERIRQARLLFDGNHREYFIQEGRSQFEFPPVRATGVWGDRTIQMYLTLNLLSLISSKNADLMFGEQPLLRVVADPKDTDGQAAVMVSEDTQRGYLRELAERSDLHSLFHTKATDCSAEAEAFLESVIAPPPDGQVYLEDVPSDEIFPVGVMGADHQYRQYRRLRLKNIGTKDHP